MQQYRKKPVVIEAIKCSEALSKMGEDFWSLPSWFTDAYEGNNQAGVQTIIGRHHPDCIEIVTLEGVMRADPDDYIICGVKGELYPCKPDIFEATYETADNIPLGVAASESNFSFSYALAQLKNGFCCARAGWNGKNMFIFLVNGSTFTVNREPLLSILGEGTVVDYHGHIDMRTANGQIVPWLASQTDLLADDWTIVASTFPKS